MDNFEKTNKQTLLYQTNAVVLTKTNPSTILKNEALDLL